MLETLNDAISEAKAKADRPWLVIAGDWNKYSIQLDTTIKAYPDLKKHLTGPDRLGERPT